MRTWPAKACLLASTMLSLHAVGAAAQDAGSASDEDGDLVEMEELVVLGRRFGQGLSRATFTLGAEDIRERPLGAEITQSLNQIPGLQVATGDSRGGSFSFEIYLRGLTDEQIGLSVDGIPTGDSRFNGGQPPNRFLESSNVSQIVVSQSAGDIGSPSRFALGGFIDFQTDDPQEDFGFTVEGGYGSFDFHRYFARADFGEVLPGLTGYASFSKQESDVHAGRKSRSRDREHVDFKLLKEFANGSTVRLRTSYNDLNDNDFNIITLDEFNDDPRSDRAGDVLTGVPSLDRDFGGALGGSRDDWLVYINADIVVADDVSVSVNPYYHSLRGESFRYQDRQRDLDGDDPRAVLGFDALGGAIRPDVIVTRDDDVVGGPADLRVTPRDRDRYGVTAEARADNLFGFNNVRVGIWYEDNESTEFRNFFPLIDSRVGLDFNESDLAFVEYERTAKVDTLMIYAQDQIVLLDGRLKLDLGLTFHDVSYQARSPLEYNTVVDFSQDSGVNPKVGVAFQVTDQLELFAGYAQNFGGIPEDVFLGSSAVINPGDLDPVETDNVDVGARFVTDGLALSLQGYYVNLKNNIGIVPSDPSADPDDIIRGNADTRAANLAGTQTLGLEATAFVQLGDFDLYATYAYQDAEHDTVDSAEELANLLASAIIPGERIRDIPRHSFYAELGWEPLEEFRLAVNVNYVGERIGAHFVSPDFCAPVNPFTPCFDLAGDPLGPSEAFGTQTLDSYTLVGLTAQYSLRAGRVLDAVTFQLNIDNLLDEEFVSAVSGATATLPEFGALFGAGATLDRYFIGFPRTVTFSVRAEF